MSERWTQRHSEEVSVGIVPTAERQLSPLEIQTCGLGGGFRRPSVTHPFSLHTFCGRRELNGNPVAVRDLVAVPPLRPRRRHALFLLPVFSPVWRCRSARRRACSVATWWSLERGTLMARHSWRGIHPEGCVSGTCPIRREREWECDRRERQYAYRATLAFINILAQPAAAAASTAAAVAGTSLPDALLPGRSVGSGNCLADSRWGGDIVGDASPR